MSIVEIWMGTTWIRFIPVAFNLDRDLCEEHLLMQWYTLPKTIWPLKSMAKYHLSLVHSLSFLYGPFLSGSWSIELSYNQMELSIGSWSPMIFHWLLCIQYQLFLSTLWCMLEVVSESADRATSFGTLRAKSILAPLGMPMWVWPSMNRYSMLFVQISTLPLSCTANLPNTEGVVCKLTNSWPKVMLS